ncbi:MAG: DUF1152 domain-containing protein [Verrucomicrobia bacterium]|nr:DUF1152 domain-containing protein [Verrucomicrobiota bacterium]
MNLPFFEELQSARTVLLAGAGGGYDLFTGLPLLAALRRAGKTVHLANLTFSDLRYEDAETLRPGLVRISDQSHGSAAYCPEVHLARWLADQGQTATIYLFERTGAKSVAESYRLLVEQLQPDTVILVDGGTDSLMRGDESGLGTPQEDMASLAAVNQLSGVERRFLVCLGFGIDAFHGVSHGLVLENMAQLIADNGFLGAWSLLHSSPEFAFYRAACDYVHARMPHHPSIVNSSIIDATTGWFGDHHATQRTEGSSLFINPLMSLYWAFHVEAVARRNLYLPLILHTNSYLDLALTIERFHLSLPKLRTWKPIPC